MRFVVVHTDGRIETGQFEGENLTLGLGGTLTPCVCGKRDFVDAWRTWPEDRTPEQIGEDPPDRLCTCGRKYWYFDADDDQAGYLHQKDDHG